MIDLLKDKEVANHIHEAKMRLVMETNAGKKLKQFGNVPDFRDVWFEPTEISNIYGISDMVQRSDYVTMDTRIYNGLTFI